MEARRSDNTERNGRTREKRGFGATERDGRRRGGSNVLKPPPQKWRENGKKGGRSFPLCAGLEGSKSANAQVSFVKTVQWTSLP